MLIEFRVGNFRSFAEPQIFSLVASADTRHADHCIPFRKLRLLKSAAIYGANASGKSNLIRAIDFVRWFTLSSATWMNVGDEIPVVPFQLSADWRGRASLFEVIFEAEGVRYRYGFTANAKRVQDEWLTAYPKGRAQHLLERRFDLRTEQTSWTFRGELQKAGALLRERTRGNGLALSRGAELNVAPLTSLLLWFRQKMSVLNLSAPPESLIEQTAQRFKDDPTFRQRVLRLIRHADLGISDLEVSEEHRKYYSLTDLESVLRGNEPISPKNTVISRDVPSAFSGGAFFQAAHSIAVPTIRSIHRTPDGAAVGFDFQEAESNGTQRFFALAGPWLDTLDQGSLLVIDELDSSMHPSLTWKVVELFQTLDANPHGAQLVFSTHDSTLMDLHLLRRDQIWIVEKDRAGASHLSSLYDFDEKPRNDEAVQRRYLAGRYGGVPVFGPTFEDLELK